MFPLDPSLRAPLPGTVVALPMGGKGGIEGDLLRALLQAGRVEARVLQVLGQSALIDFLDLGTAKVHTEAPLRAGDAFTAMVEPPETSSEPVQLRISQMRHEPAVPLRPERLAGQLEAMAMPVDAKHQAMARALLRHAGTVSREAMTQLGDAITRLAAKNPDVQPAKPQSLPSAELPARAAVPPSKLPLPVKIVEAAAFLVAKGLPVEEESVAWVADRLNLPTTSGERLATIARQLPPVPTLASEALLGLAVPEGEAPEVAAHVIKLVKAFTPPEAQIAKALTPPEAQIAKALTPPEAQIAKPVPEQPAEKVFVQPSSKEEQDPAVPARPESPTKPVADPLAKIREAMTAVLERAVRSAEGGEPIREALAEVRFGQLVNVSAPDPLHPSSDRSFALPLWWNAGSGEIRVHYQPREGRKRSSGGSEETRVVVTLDTTHLQRVRVDLLLGQKQLNCQVAVEDQATAELLRQRLPELKEALESVGLRVNALGVKMAASKQDAMPADSLRQVDVWL